MLARLAAELAGSFPAQFDSELVADQLEPWALPADGAPALELLAEFHRNSEVRLFAS
jgi:hypothetical protein